MGHTGVSRTRRWLTRGLLIAPASLTIVAAGASPASAHAVLDRTSPAAESVVPTSPHLLSLTFDEGVYPARDAIRLYDDRLRPVAVGPTSHPGGAGKVVAAPVPSALVAGTYTVTWRVTSDDSHVVAGSFRFSVGHRSVVRAGAPPGTRHDSTTSWLAAFARGMGYAGLATGPGALVVTAWLWPAALTRRRVRRLLYAGGGLLVTATLAGIVVQGAAAAGVAVQHALTGADVRLGMAGRFGRAAAARVVLIVAMTWLVLTSHSRRGSVSARTISMIGVALAATWPYAGHSGTGDIVPVAAVADLVHVAAMATWLGGLAVLLLDPDTDQPVESYSEWALNAVTLLVATGLFATWRNVRDIGALTATHYGRLLLWKSGVVVAVVAVAYFSRRVVSVTGKDGILTRPRLRRAVGAETVGAVVVLGITAFLTGNAPAAQTYAPAFTRSAVYGGMTVTLHVDRTGVGETHLIVSTTRAARALPIRHIDGSLSELDPPVGPLPVTFRAAGTGRAVAIVSFPDAGQWSLSLDVQTSSASEIAVTTTIRVRG